MADLAKGKCIGLVGFTEQPVSWQRKLCDGCPVRLPCLEFAVEREQAEVEAMAAESGKPGHSHLGFLARHAAGVVYGGLTTAERTKIIATRLGESPEDIRSEPGEYSSCGTPAGYVAHSRLGEFACKPCKAAQTAYQRRRRAKAKAERLA